MEELVREARGQENKNFKSELYVLFRPFLVPTSGNMESALLESHILVSCGTLTSFSSCFAFTARVTSLGNYKPTDTSQSCRLSVCLRKTEEAVCVCVEPSLDDKPPDKPVFVLWVTRVTVCIGNTLNRPWLPAGFLSTRTLSSSFYNVQVL